MLQEFLDKLNITPQKIAVGVSGGSDSLGAVLMANEELKSLGYSVVALTIDHRLRPSSENEALFVANLMKKNGIEHHTIVWEGKKPKTGIEEEARLARYDLIENWCQKNSVSYLITAHHLFDQAETFLMRLSRGSGLDGLCGMKEKTAFKSIHILRPFLKTDPNTFKAYLKKKNIIWVEDESNFDENLLRVRMRKFLPVLEKKTGITPLQIASTMERLQASRIYFENKIQSLIKNNFKTFENSVFACSLPFLLCLESELQYRLMSHILKTVAKTPYSPEAEKILHLIEKLQQENFKSATLNHCKILSRDDFIWFLPEKQKTTGKIDKAWKNYIATHAQYKKIKIPSEVKRFILSLQN